MPRLTPITSPDQLPPESRPIAEAIVGSRGQISGPFAMMLHSPAVAGRAAHLGAYIRFEAQLPKSQTELATIAAAREFDCAFEWAAHEGQARQAGVREEAIDVVANRRGLDSLTEGEATIVGYVRELLRDHRVSDETFTRARQLFSDAQLVELTATLGYYAMLACTLNAFEVPAPAGGPRLP